jgi:hypothetical protein
MPAILGYFVLIWLVTFQIFKTFWSSTVVTAHSPIAVALTTTTSSVLRLDTLMSLNQAVTTALKHIANDPGAKNRAAEIDRVKDKPARLPKGWTSLPNL